MSIKFLSFNPSSPNAGYWDQSLPADILKDPVFNFIDEKGAIIVIPGAYQGDYINQINENLSKYEWVILIITSDEESKFPVEKINHPNIRIWVQYPKKGRHDKYNKFPLGYTGETRKNLRLAEKILDVFYSGQKTHIRRELCSKALHEMHAAKDEDNFVIHDTEGFTKGFAPSDYMDYMSAARVAPSPSGAISADSFRTYEALEAGAIPIADNISLTDSDYWQYLFGSVPFPTINDYDSLPGYIEDTLDNFQEKANQIQAWWIRQKRELRDRIILDYESLTGRSCPSPVTIMIPISYIPSHPDTHVLAETIKSVRYHFPDLEIILTFDGLRDEHKQHKEKYHEFIRRALFLANTEWGNVYPIIFNDHQHQIGMAREALKIVNTDLLLYVEQDTPLVTDEPIEWIMLQDHILTGNSNMIRFHFEGVIPEPHKHLMIGTPEDHLLKTIQWSQRPHLASTAFYRRILEQYFSKDAKCFLEDVLHGKLMGDYKENGLQGWNQWRVHIYYPNDKNIKRSLNLDGRQGAEKFDDKQIW